MYLHTKLMGTHFGLIIIIGEPVRIIILIMVIAFAFYFNSIILFIVNFRDLLGSFPTESFIVIVIATPVTSLSESWALLWFVSQTTFITLGTLIITTLTVSPCWCDITSPGPEFLFGIYGIYTHFSVTGMWLHSVYIF